MVSLLHLSLILNLAVSAAPQPSRAALRRAVEADSSAAVQVRAGARLGPGLQVGASGEVLTTIDFITEAPSRLQRGEMTCEARLVHASAESRLALVACDAPLAESPIAVSGRELSAGQWVIAVVRSKRAASPRPVRLFAEKDGTLYSPPLPLGTPLYDEQGRLAGLVSARERRGARVLPISALKEHARATATEALRTLPTP